VSLLRRIAARCAPTAFAWAALAVVAVAQTPAEPAPADSPGPALAVPDDAPLPATGTPAPPIDLSQQFSAANAAAATPVRQQAQSDRLAQAPEMFGDSMVLAGLSGTTLIFGFGSDFGLVDTAVSFPLGNMGQRVSDQNSPLPHDRIFYRYSYFKDVASMSTELDALFTDANFAAQRSLSVHTMGFEKTFFDGWCSFELRAPFAERKNFTETFTAGDFVIDQQLAFGGEGNLYAVGKLLLYEGYEFAAAGGLAVDIPSGRDATFSIANEINTLYRNDATYLTPFLATLWTPTQKTFYQGWLGVDVPVGNNQVDVIVPGGEFGSLVEASLDVDQVTLMTADLLAGYWFYQNRRDFWIEGVAGIFEVHYTGALEDANIAVFNEGGLFGDTITATGSALGRFDVVNITPAIHLQVRDNWSVRLGGVFPVADRMFDNEFSVQSILRF
jgi:hypothetical protein